MSSPSAAGVVRRRSRKTCVGVSLQSGTRNGSRQLDVRVNTTRLRSSGDTASAPAKLQRGDVDRVVQADDRPRRGRPAGLTAGNGERRHEE
jgi:hypothetical protein